MSTMSIPAFHVSDATVVKGRGEGFIESRKDASSSGVFLVEADIQFNPPTNTYPVGSLAIETHLNDGAKGVFRATSIELINSYGKANPTVYITGRCAGDAATHVKGYRYWVLIVQNRASDEGTMNVAGFAVHDDLGNRVAYGTGTVKGAFAIKAE